LLACYSQAVTEALADLDRASDALFINLQRR